MASSAVRGAPIKVEFEDAAAWKELKEAVSIGTIGNVRPAITVTTLASTREEKIPGQSEAVEREIMCHKLDDDVDQTRFLQLAELNERVQMRFTWPPSRAGSAGKVTTVYMRLLGWQYAEPAPDQPFDVSISAFQDSDPVNV